MILFVALALSMSPIVFIIDEWSERFGIVINFVHGVLLCSLLCFCFYAYRTKLYKKSYLFVLLPIFCLHCVPRKLNIYLPKSTFVNDTNIMLLLGFVVVIQWLR